MILRETETVESVLHRQATDILKETPNRLRYRMNLTGQIIAIVKKTKTIKTCGKTCSNVT